MKPAQVKTVQKKIHSIISNLNYFDSELTSTSVEPFVSSTWDELYTELIDFMEALDNDLVKSKKGWKL